MTQTHPIMPPDGLVQQLRHNMGTWLDQITIAYQAGADQELEACLDWLDDTDCEDPQEGAQRLRAARRILPPSLKEQALVVLMALEIDEPGYEGTYNTIRRALEQLPN